MATLTDAQKVVRNDTAKRMAAALEKMVTALGGIPHAQNLLYNWYFIGGGSQLGDGVFPINQRGQTSYQGAVFCVDRWYVTSGSKSQVTIDADGIIFKNTANTNRFSQHAPISLAGKTVTLSALCTAIDGARYAVTIQTDAGNSTTTYTTDKITSVTFTVPATAVTINAQIRTEDAGASVKIHAMKLEIGSYQTLAHQENGDWVLNELPNWAEEMEKCMRFYYPFSAYFRASAVYRSASVLDFTFAIPVRMQGAISLVAPNMVVSASKGENGALVEQTGFDFSLLSVQTVNGIITVRGTKSGHGLLAANVIIMRAGTGAYLSTE